MFSNSEEREHKSIKNLEKKDDLHESEVIEQRTTPLVDNKPEDSIVPEDSDLSKEKEIRKVPFLIKAIGILHLILISGLFYGSIYFYNQYVDFKGDGILENGQFTGHVSKADIQSGMRILKAVLCIIGGFVLAYSRATLLENYQ